MQTPLATPFLSDYDQSNGSDGFAGTLVNNRERHNSHSTTTSTAAGRKKKAIWDVTDSLNYSYPTNAVNMVRQRNFAEPHRRILFGVTGRTLTSLFTTLVSGVLIGITARLMEGGADTAVDLRNHLLASFWRQAPLQGLCWFFLFSVSTVLVTSAVVQWIAPGAAGTGVSLVIALLNGNNIAGLLTPAVVVVKLFGTCAARFACLAVGPEAPMVHLGASVASLVFAVERRIWSKKAVKKALTNAWTETVESATTFSNSVHRETVSAGAAAGLAAAFGAPIGGVLFALEEACSVWSRKTAWRCLICTATAVFTMSQLDPRLNGGAILSFSGIYQLSSRQWLMQMPAVVLVSVLAGFIGALFNIMRGGIRKIRAARRKHGLRLLEGALVAAITVAVIFFTSNFFGRCLSIPESWQDKPTIQWSCPSGQYNDLATALLGPSPFLIRSILGMGSESEPINDNSNNICTIFLPCYFSITTLAILCIVYLCLAVLSSGLAVPGGLFMPSIVIGSSFGAVAGMLFASVLPPSWDIQPGVYAMIGATATMAAVFRSSISLVVIMVEGTRGIQFLPGILAATIISNFIAHWVHPEGIYESELERDGRVFFLRQEPPGALRWSTARDIMATPVIGLPRIVEVSRIVEVLTCSLHNGFPVFPLGDDNNNDSGTGTSSGITAQQSAHQRQRRLEGFILRTQLLVLLQERAFCDAAGQYLHPPPDPPQFESYLNLLMMQAENSCDGLAGGAEMAIAVDPLGRTSSEDELVGLGVVAALGPTIETLETLRALPSVASVLDESTVRAVMQAVGEGLNHQQHQHHYPALSMLLGEGSRSFTAYEGDSNGNGSHLFSSSPPPPPLSPIGEKEADGLNYTAPTPRSSAPVLYLNIEPFMDRGMFTVRLDTPATNVHRMFVCMSLRHLCVVNDDGNVAGIITRKDLDHAGGEGWWRQNKMAPTPHRSMLDSSLRGEREGLGRGEGGAPPYRARSWLQSLLDTIVPGNSPRSAAENAAVAVALVNEQGSTEQGGTGIGIGIGGARNNNNGNMAAEDIRRQFWRYESML